MDFLNVQIFLYIKVVESRFLLLYMIDFISKMNSVLRSFKVVKVPGEGGK